MSHARNQLERLMFLQQMFPAAEFHSEYREQAAFYSCLVQINIFHTLLFRIFLPNADKEALN